MATILDTQFTKETLEKTLQSSIPTDAVIESFTATDVGSGKGFLSVLARVDLNWSTDDATLPKSVAVKIPSKKQLILMAENSDDNMKKMTENILANSHKLHWCETAFYTSCANRPDFPLTTAKVYGVDRGALPDYPGYIIEEDMSVNGVQVNQITGFNLEQTKKIMEAIAKMQAWSIKNPDWQKPDMDIDIYSAIGDIDNIVTSMNKFYDFVDQDWVIDALGKQLCIDAKKITANADSLKSTMQMHKEYGLPSVMVHGDLWSSNMFFFADEEKQPSNKLKAFIDWQTIHKGCPTTDINRLITMSVRYEVYNSKIDEILGHYHSTLAEQFDGKAPFDYDTTKELFERQFVQFICLSLPMMSNMFQMIKAGIFKLSDMTPDELHSIMLDDLKGMLIQTIAYIDKYKSKK